MAEKLLNCSDGHRLSYNIWLPIGKKPKAFVHILHGMAEHSKRYKDFALYLNNAGYAVFAQDHRGHGASATNEGKGWFAECDGWNIISRDSFELANFVATEYENPKIFLLGHSMGSFLARTLMVQHPDFYSGVIIMGTSCSKGLAGKIGKLICNVIIKTHGSRSAGTTMNKLCFGSYNKAFSPAFTNFDWLSSDTDQVSRYIEDPMCGFLCTNGFFRDLLNGVEFANKISNAKLVPKDLPILIVSGDMDPVGDNGRGVKKVFDMYRKTGIADVKMKLYSNMRHEILNEIDNILVYKDIRTWLDNHI